MRKQYIKPLAKTNAVGVKTDLLDFDLIGGYQSGGPGTNTNTGANERCDFDFASDSGFGGSSESESTDNGAWESLW